MNWDDVNSSYLGVPANNRKTYFYLAWNVHEYLGPGVYPPNIFSMHAHNYGRYIINGEGQDKVINFGILAYLIIRKSGKFSNIYLIFFLICVRFRWFFTRFLLFNVDLINERIKFVSISKWLSESGFFFYLFLLVDFKRLFYNCCVGNYCLKVWWIHKTPHKVSGYIPTHFHYSARVCTYLL